MHQDDREHQMDDDSSQRGQHEEPRTPPAPVARMLANPRRVRRA